MRTRLSQFSGNPMQSPLDMARGKGHRPQLTKGELTGHKPVLLHEVVELLSVRPTDIVVDATLGGAGHACALAKALGKKGVLAGFDADPDAIERARKALAGVAPKVHLVEANFRDLAAELEKLGIRRIDKVLFDLGWSSFQLDAGRGFSLTSDEPLLMTYSKDGNALTAARIVNEWEESSIADVIYGWGEERYSRRIAKAIALRREKQPFETARDLAETIYAAVPPRYRFGKIHPATRTFQALRIAVNDELGSLTQALNAGWYKLAAGGRIAVIAFHSIEDRLVKQVFKQWEDAGEGKRITRKPATPSEEELRSNPRARSAKLRVIQKIKP